MRIWIRIRRIRIRILNTAFGDFDLIHNGYFMFFKCYRYRFDKETVVRLTEQLPNLERPNDRGRPLTPIQQVCITLGYFGGGQLTRIAGLCGGVSQKAAWWAIRRVTSELADLKGQVIRMPTDEECEATARRLEGRYHLPGFAFGVDGTVVKFEDAPREIPDDTVQQDFWCRKMHYAINCQIVGNDEGLILDLNADWQGSTNDARIWANSPVKHIINRQRRFLVAGDSAYPISETCITPYRVAEAAADPSKRLFNKRHSGLRTRCTENLYGRLKKRMRVLKLLRCKYEYARETVIACCVLHNIGILWADRDPEDGQMPPPAAPVPVVAPPVVPEDDEEPALVRARGQALRDRLRLNMPR
jgi:hypothetical protein